MAGSLRLSDNQFHIAGLAIIAQGLTILNMFYFCGLQFVE